MNNNLVQFKDLQQFTGYKPVNKVIDVLEQNGIKYLVVKNGVSTTVDAINKGLGLSKQNINDEYSV